MQQAFVSQPPRIRIQDKLLKFQENLGKGAFGIVYKVTDERTSYDHALKDVLCLNPVQIATAIREVETLKQISHENVIAVKGVSLRGSQGLDMLVLTEYCAGGNLNDRLSRPSNDLIQIDASSCRSSCLPPFAWCGSPRLNAT